METNTTLIVLGTGACCIARDTRLKVENNRLRIFFMDSEKDTAESLSDALLSDRSHSDKHIILFSTLGGHTGSSHALELAEWFAKKGIACQAIFSVPFFWEGKTKIERSLEVLSAMEKHGYPIFVFCNDLMSKRNKLSLNEAFQWRDKEIVAIIEQLLAGINVNKDKRIHHFFCTKSKEVRQMYDTILLKMQEMPQDKNIPKSLSNMQRKVCIIIHNLGIAYYEGKEVAQDFSKSLKYLIFAAEEGYVGDERIIAEMYEEGIGTIPDKEKALEWYHKAGLQGNVDALCNLGDMYEVGQGIPQNDRKALKCFRKVAQSQTAYAQYKLGCIYENGRGVEKDNLQAFKWYSKANGQRFQPAYLKLKAMYDNGLLELSRKKQFKWKETPNN